MQRPDGPAFAKGHGTENDFVILPDTDGCLALTRSRVRALCDRRRGFGADGVLRVARASAVADAPGDVPADAWFMDYRNADGSVAEMCGNGIRVFARYLVEAGFAEPGRITVGTRAGARTVHTREDGQVSVDMGPVVVFGKSSVAIGGRTWTGIAVNLGNPHLACVTGAGIDDLDLEQQPPYDAELFPGGVNIEFVEPVSPGRVRMRVHERGVGETRSCGTGTVAAAAAALHEDGAEAGAVVVDTPGGRVEVEITESTSTLTGPAVLVGWGRLDERWWGALDA